MTMRGFVPGGLAGAGAQWGDAPRRALNPLNVAVAVSVALHVVVLSLNFKFPESIRFQLPPQLEVTLVNSKSARRPDDAQLLAQANLDGGGNTDADVNAKTPAPVLKRTERGDAEQASRRVREMETQQSDMLFQMRKPPRYHTVEPEKRPQREPVPEVRGADLAANAMSLARMEAQIARQIEDYNRRPRRHFVGARAREVRYAQYVEDWRLKVERVGNLNYPSEARGKLYGSLQVTVAIKADGSLESVQIDRPSTYPLLDRAAERIVRLAAPYAAFPPDVRKDTDILVITRTWTFAPGDQLVSQ